MSVGYEREKERDGERLCALERRREAKKTDIEREKTYGGAKSL